MPSWDEIETYEAEALRLALIAIHEVLEQEATDQAKLNFIRRNLPRELSPWEEMERRGS